MTIFGWDASDFDWARGPMDMVAARADGIEFFTHKATEGTGFRHTRYGEALNRASLAGIPFLGAYIVIRSGSVAAQVDYFLSYLDSQTPWWRSMPEFFLQVDLEHWPYDQVSPSQGVAACELLRQRSGKWVVLYAPQWAYGNTIGGTDPLWASGYGANPAVPYRQAYPGDGDGKRWQAYSTRTPVFLQFGSATTIGRQLGCDANAFRGSVADLRRLVTGSANPGQGPFLPAPLSGVKMKLYRLESSEQGVTIGPIRMRFDTPDERAAFIRIWGAAIDGPEVGVSPGDERALGVEVYRLIDSGSGSGGGGTGGPVELSAKGVQQVEDAAFRADQKAEDQ